MTWIGGGFSDRGFTTGGFNTGIMADVSEDETMAPPDRYTADKFRHYERVKREDEEILAVILNSITSGILEK